MRRVIKALSCVCILCLACASSRSATQESSTPTVGFDFSFPGSQPDRYAFSIPGSGDATYSSDGRLTPNSDSDDFRVTFPISRATRSRIFELAQKARYFQGELDSKKKGLASTGIKTLSYKDSQRQTRASYNYSFIPAVQELTQIFQGMSATLEFGRRLDYYHRYQKLALDDELKRMDEMLKQNSVQELTAIAPVLKEIVEDSSVINPVRARAQRILARVGGGVQ